MAVYTYLTKNMEGNRKEGEIRADSLDTAIQKLSTNGQLVISMKEVDDTAKFPSNIERFSLTIAAS